VSNNDRALYVISVAAELAGMHPQTLRIYERRGLVSPARTTGGNRRYSDADIARLRRIAQLASTGMNLEGIRHVMSLEEEVARLRAEVDRLRDLAVAAITEIEKRQASSGADLVPFRQQFALFTNRPGFFGPLGS
jgi:MerR family transcriptional regulator/heat shock protein HspR